METNKADALHSKYIIDGVPQDLTPYAILEECVGSGGNVMPEAAGVIVDESEDPDLRHIPALLHAVPSYIEAISGHKDVFPFQFADSYTRNLIDRVLLDAVWRKGHFASGDLCVTARWEWNTSGVGSMAAFYSSVQALADYLDRLDIRLSAYSFEPSEQCSLHLEVSLAPDVAPEGDSDSLFDDSPFRSVEPQMQQERQVPACMSSDSSDWVIYVPFDTCDYRFGGSAFALSQGYTGTTAPEVDDPDYFLDCYEVVRELVEDGIIKAGCTVGKGGLAYALDGMTRGASGICADLGALARASGQDNEVKVAFAEVPGVLIEIADDDFDYVDAELLLQDVAFYPLGHPCTSKKGFSLAEGGKIGLEAILGSLINK